MADEIKYVQMIGTGHGKGKVSRNIMNDFGGAKKKSPPMVGRYALPRAPPRMYAPQYHGIGKGRQRSASQKGGGVVGDILGSIAGFLPGGQYIQPALGVLTGHLGLGKKRAQKTRGGKQRAR